MKTSERTTDFLAEIRGWPLLSTRYMNYRLVTTIGEIINFKRRVNLPKNHRLIPDIPKFKYSTAASTSTYPYVLLFKTALTYTLE